MITYTTTTRQLGDLKFKSITIIINNIHITSIKHNHHQLSTNNSRRLSIPEFGKDSSLARDKNLQRESSQSSQVCAHSPSTTLRYLSGKELECH